jgi:hypothetical protein
MDLSSDAGKDIETWILEYICEKEYYKTVEGIFACDVNDLCGSHTCVVFFSEAAERWMDHNVTPPHIRQGALWCSLVQSIQDAKYEETLVFTLQALRAFFDTPSVSALEALLVKQFILDALEDAITSRNSTETQRRIGVVQKLISSPDHASFVRSFLFCGYWQGSTDTSITAWCGPR